MLETLLMVCLVPTIMVVASEICIAILDYVTTPPQGLAPMGVCLTPCGATARPLPWVDHTTRWGDKGGAPRDPPSGG